MILLIKKYRHLLAILSIAGQGLIYMLIASFMRHSATPINNSLDDRIPYLSWFVIFYAAWMLILYLAFIYIGITNHALYWRTIITYNIAVTMSNIIFILFPTHMPRPIISDHNIFDRLVEFIYSNDEPVNCFPSIHCLTSYLLFITMYRHKLLSIGLRIFFSIIFWGIIASTMFIKQHSLVDVIGGIVLAEITYRALYYVLDKKEKVLVTGHNENRVTLNG